MGRGRRLITKRLKHALGRGSWVVGRGSWVAIKILPAQAGMAQDCLVIVQPGGAQLSYEVAQDVG